MEHNELHPVVLEMDQMEIDEDPDVSLSHNNKQSKVTASLREAGEKLKEMIAAPQVTHHDDTDSAAGDGVRMNRMYDDASPQDRVKRCFVHNRKPLCFLMVFTLIVIIVFAVIIQRRPPNEEGKDNDRGGRNTVYGLFTLRSTKNSTTTMNPNPILKSPSDTRLYSSFILPNGLEVLLVQDDTSEFGAAALDVSVGSQNDPPEFQGLAHFLEHMLFLGSVTYPDESGYSQFLTLNGGYDNAYTSQDHTNFFFQVRSAVLRDALDRFGHFFIDPLLTQSGTGREVHAVNSEHQKNVQSDGWREFQLFLQLANPASLVHHFGTGSLDTLNKNTEALHTAVVRFYDEHYTNAKKMKLCVTAPISLSVMQKWVEEIFTQIPNIEREPQQGATPPPPPPYLPSEMPMRVHVVPVGKATRKITIMFPLNYDIETHYHHQISGYLNYLHSGKHNESIFYCLRNKGWIETFSFEVYDNTEYVTFLKTTIDLTEAGVSHYSEIFTEYYAFLNILTQNTKASGCTVWNDYVAIQNVVFRFQDKVGASDYTSRLANTMQTVNVVDVLGSPQHWVCDVNALMSVLNFMVPANSIETVWFGGTDETTMTYKEQHYGTLYNVTRRVNPVTPSTPVLCPGLGIRPPNSFIPQTFDTPFSDVHMKSPSLVAGVSGAWKQHSDRFGKVPKVDFRCKVKIGSPDLSPEGAVALKLYAVVVGDTLQESLSDLGVFGMVGEMDVSQGVNLRVFGYPDVVSRVLNQLLDTVDPAKLQAKFPSSRFPILVAQYLQSVRSVRELLLYQIIARYLRVLVFQSPTVSLSVQEDVLTSSSFSIDSVWKVVNSLYSSTKVSCLTFGDYLKETDPAEMASSVIKVTSKSIAPESSIVHHGELVLTDGEDHLLYMSPILHTDTNEGILFRYEFGDQDTYPAALVLGKIIANRCFDELRTKQQLGYVVSCWVMRSDLHNRTGVTFYALVQSGSYNASVLIRQVDAFLTTTYWSELQGTTQDTLEMAINGIVTSLTEPPLTMDAEADIVWNEITSEHYQFDRVATTVAQVRGVGIQKVQEIYKKYVVDGSTRRRVVLAVGRGAPTPQPGGNGGKLVQVTNVTNAYQLSQWKELKTFQ